MAEEKTELQKEIEAQEEARQAEWERRMEIYLQKKEKVATRKKAG